MFYTGIGSRTTPLDIRLFMSGQARALELEGMVLRSGGANGADSAFADGVCDKDNARIYLPWFGFNSKTGIVANESQWSNAEKVASTIHPFWQYLKPSVKKLHARNCFQVLGLDLQTPSDFLLCWTPDGAEDELSRSEVTGGTGTAIVLAYRCAIPIINFRNDNAKSRLQEFISPAQFRDEQHRPQ